MKPSISTICMVMMLLTNSDFLLGMNNPLALAKPTITITNNGTIPFTLQVEILTNNGNRPITTKTKKLGECIFITANTQKKLLAVSCTTETYLTLRACDQVIRYPLRSALGFSEDETTSEEKTLAITIDDDSEGCISASFTNKKCDFFLLGEPITPVISSRTNPLYNESDTSETTDSIAIDSPVASPQPKSENYQGVICANNAN